MVNFCKKYLISVKSKNELKKYNKYKEKKSLQNKTNISINKNLFKIKYYKNNLIEKFFFSSYPNLDIIISQYLLK